ncbi:MAG: C-type lectin domain-containing protein [Myxococcales bacterium]|nr:C-type lectin domain-containing protein [Myxococcales bacterium]
MPPCRLIGLLAPLGVLVAGGCTDQVVGQFDAGETSTETADPSHDGLVDEVSAGLDACNDCQLLQGAGQAWWVCEATQTWADAEAWCEGLGAHAAVVPSLVAQTFLHQQVGQGWFWLGAHQDADEGAWRWVDGTPLGYANWGTTQPDDTAPGQDCLRLTFGIDGEGWFDGAWDDFFCDDAHRVMCSAPHAAP